jgi:hypothetical protein
MLRPSLLECYPSAAPENTVLFPGKSIEFEIILLNFLSCLAPSRR